MRLIRTWKKDTQTCFETLDLQFSSRCCLPDPKSILILLCWHKHAFAYIYTFCLCKSRSILEPISTKQWGLCFLLNETTGACEGARIRDWQASTDNESDSLNPLDPPPFIHLVRVWRHSIISTETIVNDQFIDYRYTIPIWKWERPI